MNYYELATLHLPFGAGGKAAEAVPAYCAEGAGAFLGAWNLDLGRINRMIVMRGFETIEDLLAERARAHESTSPFGCGAFLSDMVLDSYAPFPFMAPVAPGAYGAVYEFRTYGFRHGGYPRTVEKWQAALPRREEYSRCLIAMRALDGMPRFTNIWPYADLNARAAARGQSVADGVWPPKGGPDWLTTEMVTQIGLPAPGSPLR